MGRMAIIITAGLILSSGIFHYMSNRSNVDRVENVSDYFKFTVARNIAHSAVTIALRRLDTGDTASFGGSAMDGEYKVRLAFVGDTVEMTSRGQFMDTSFVMFLRLKTEPKPFPNVQAPVLLRIPRVNFGMPGNSVIDGRDHDVNGNLPFVPDEKTGVLVITDRDSQTVAGYNSKIIGTPKERVDLEIPNPEKFVQEYLTLADYSYTAGVYGGNQTWGSEASPAIIMCDAGSGTVKFSGTIEGWGILVVRGNLTLSGTFTFRGLVIAYQDASINYEFTTDKGTPRVIGAMLVSGGSGSSFNLKGNARVLYSSDALKLAQYMKKLLTYRIISWYE